MPGGIQTDQYCIPGAQPGGSFAGNQSGPQETDFLPGDFQNVRIRFPELLFLLAVE